MKETATEHFGISVAPFYILGCALFAIFWGVVSTIKVRGVSTENNKENQDVINKCIDDCAANNNFKRGEKKEDFNADEILKTLNKCGELVTNGARSFLKQEYTYLMIWSFLFAIVLGTTVDYLEMHNEEAPTDFPYTAVSYLVGSITSIIAGYIGMEIAVYTNTRVTFQCAYGATKDHEIKSSGDEK